MYTKSVAPHVIFLIYLSIREPTMHGDFCDVCHYGRIWRIISPYFLSDRI